MRMMGSTRADDGSSGMGTGRARFLLEDDYSDLLVMMMMMTSGTTHRDELGVSAVV